VTPRHLLLAAAIVASALSGSAFGQTAVPTEPPGQDADPAVGVPADYIDPFADSGDADFIDPFADSGDASPTNPAGKASLPSGAFISDFDKLFENAVIIEVEESTSAIAAAEALLTSEQGVDWSGSFSGGFDFGFDWDDYLRKGILRTPDADSLNPRVSGTLKFDARPEPGFRILGKFKLSSSGGFGNLAALGIDLSSFTASTDASGNLIISQGSGNTDEEDEAKEEPVPDQNQVSLQIGVEELFSDFTWNNRLFFRFGKSFIKWGKGYFWSPADILNLSSIDAEDPTADRQGPVNLKMNWPVGINNLNFYMLMDGATVWEHLGLAANAEIVLGKFELGLGGFWQQTRAPRLVSTFSGSIGKVGLFGEAALSIGSDRVFVRRSRLQPEFAEPQPGEDPPTRYTALDTFTVDQLPFFFATLGFMYTYTDWKLSLTGQYYFNGEGYPASATRFADGTSLLDAAAYLRRNPGSNGLALPADQQPSGYTAPPALGTSDLTNFGRHYAGLSIRLSELFDNKDLSLSTFILCNLSDLSGIASTSLNWRLFDRASLSLGGRVSFGEPGDEYTNPRALFAQDPDASPQVPSFNLTVGLSLGGGSF
jgi:hypothetical protein